ncbi:MAG: hypothetical protein PHW96_04950 [Candidatus Nanoarchaeia archaeon]|nr:hypothetical protein [Candidatus Nanoarchaeia archaeon]
MDLENSIQKEFEYYISTKQILLARKFYEKQKTKPKITENIKKTIQGAYIELLNRDRREEAYQLYELTKIRPDLNNNKITYVVKNLKNTVENKEKSKQKSEYELSYMKKILKIV